jgi:hypothetical protein
MSRKFRIATVTMNDEEDVSSVTAVAAPATLRVIQRLIGEIPFTVLGEQEMQVTLGVPAIRELHAACGKFCGNDLEYEHATEVYDSLSWVLYRMISDD